MPKPFKTAETQSTLMINRLNPHAGPRRGIGTSTAQALKYIALAIQFPNQDHPVKDHSPTKAADVILLNTIRSVVKNLDLKFFNFRVDPLGRCIIRCDIFSDRPQ